MDADDEARLLAAIAADPEDAQAREVYADWLDKRGDARGEYLRLEAHFHSIPARLAELAASMDPLWLAQVGRRYDVLLVEAGVNKIGVIKLVREISGLGLKDSKDIVDFLSSRAYRVATELDREAALRIVDRFRESGAIARIVHRGADSVVVPAVRGVRVTLVAVHAEHRVAAIQLVRELLLCSMRDAFDIVTHAISGTPGVLDEGASVERARELVARFAAIGTVQCTPA